MRICSRAPATAVRLKTPARFITAVRHLAEKRSPEAPEFDDWAFFRARRCRGGSCMRWAALVQDKDAAGDHFAATARYGGRLVELDPLSEVYGNGI